jgi:ABC-type sulfate transport system substrate-binding protein
LIRKEFGDANVDVVYPSISILAANLLAIVGKVVEKKGTHALARPTLSISIKVVTTQAPPGASPERS